MSYFSGWVARLELPPIFQGWFNQAFVKIFGLNMGESETRDPRRFASIEDLFIRRLRPDIRPVESCYVSPADGYLAWSAPLESAQAIQAKGLKYSPAELIWGKEFQQHQDLESGLSWFTTVYLAPHNYHRVHAPVSGYVTAIRHIPGDLWPVNLPFVNHFPDLFCANERLVFDIALTPPAGGSGADASQTTDGGKAYVVMVGAFNVGRMKTHMLPDFATNDQILRSVGQSHWELGVPPGLSNDDSPHAPSIAAGDELGAFLLGSTVVVVLDAAATRILRPVQAAGNRPILMGRSLNHVQ